MRLASFARGVRSPRAGHRDGGVGDALPDAVRFAHVLLLFLQQQKVMWQFFFGGGGKQDRIIRALPFGGCEFFVSRPLRLRATAELPGEDKLL